MVELPIIVCCVETPNGKQNYITCLSDAHVSKHGLAPEVIIGTLVRPLESDESIRPENFARNPVFVDFMHSVIARRAPQLAGMIAEAQRQKNGYVYIIDQRTRTPMGEVPAEDIIGAFTVENGQVVPDSYQANRNHRIFSAAGFFRLGDELQPCLLEEMANCHA